MPGTKKSEALGENGGLMVKRTQYLLTPDQSDCGYGTHPESTSITSSEDHSSQKFHQKPQRFHVVKKPFKKLSAQEQKDRRRKKLVKRSKSSLWVIVTLNRWMIYWLVFVHYLFNLLFYFFRFSINMKGLVHHTPTDEDISNLLKEFTVDFLLKGYGHLMQELYAKLLSHSDLVICS